MELGLKLELLLRRRNYKKVDFAKDIGITYRALANYLAGKRKPREAILDRIAELLNTSPQILSDPRQSILMDSEERFIFNSSSGQRGIFEAADLLKRAKSIFSGNTLKNDDKQTLFACLSEIYFNEKQKDINL
ncbi:MAG: helix-turn-helix transcriptional regulator [Eubacterium sp.]|jgi:transcriptional regulator with XRE-family HTH domain|nr:helix-turn-helix transcriptional regulator [Eubacterium sp.]